MLTKVNDVLFQCLWGHSCQFKPQKFSIFFWLTLLPRLWKRFCPHAPISRLPVGSQWIQSFQIFRVDFLDVRGISVKGCAQKFVFVPDRDNIIIYFLNDLLHGICAYLWKNAAEFDWYIWNSFLSRHFSTFSNDRWLKSLNCAISERFSKSFTVVHGVLHGEKTRASLFWFQ